jgi:clusterin-associated protein 1
MTDQVSTNDELNSTLLAAKKASHLISEITATSSRLSSLVRSEGQALQSFDLNATVESSIDNVLQTTKCTVERLDKQCKIFLSNQRGMEEKIVRKTMDIERTAKRLESLKHVRPAYMDEYEKLEEDLRVEHERFVIRLRNVDYLENELSTFGELADARQSKCNKAMKRLQRKFHEEEQRVLSGEGGAHVEALEEEPMDTSDEEASKDSSNSTSSKEDNNSFGGSEGSPSQPSFYEEEDIGDDSDSDSDSNF